MLGVRNYGFPGIFYEANPGPRLATPGRSSFTSNLFRPRMSITNFSSARSNLGKSPLHLRRSRVNAASVNQRRGCSMGRRVAVAFVGFLTGFVIALPAHAAPVSVGHSGWLWGNPRPQGNTLVAIDFAGGRGYASGSFGTLLRTDDNGLNWTAISTGLTGSRNRVRA